MIHNSTMSGNFAGDRAGAIYVDVVKALFKVVNVSFTRNYAKQYGGAIDLHTKNIDAIIENCTFLNNSADFGAAELSIETTLLRIASTHFIAHSSNSLMTYNYGQLISNLYTFNSTVRNGNITLRTTDASFIANMQNHSWMSIPRNVDVTQKETPFASGKPFTIFHARKFIVLQRLLAHVRC